MIGMTSGHGDELWRSTIADIARKVLNAAPGCTASSRR